MTSDHQVSVRSAAATSDGPGRVSVMPGGVGWLVGVGRGVRSGRRVGRGVRVGFGRCVRVGLLRDGRWGRGSLRG